VVSENIAPTANTQTIRFILNALLFVRPTAVSAGIAQRLFDQQLSIVLQNLSRRRLIFFTSWRRSPSAETYTLAGIAPAFAQEILYLPAAGTPQLPVSGF
jgi:hypothetical protein